MGLRQYSKGAKLMSEIGFFDCMLYARNYEHGCCMVLCFFFFFSNLLCVIIAADRGAKCLGKATPNV